MTALLALAALGSLAGPATLPLPIHLDETVVAEEVETVADESVWIADFDTAAALAKEQGKNLLVDFTGSDWCGWCIKLHDEVFKHDEFLNSATADYVLVALDFPRAEEIKALVPNPTRNEELKNEHEIRGFPTILLMTPDEEVFGRFGYRPGGPEKYVEFMSETAAAGLAQIESSNAIIAEYEAAGDDAALRVAAIEKGIAFVDATRESQSEIGLEGVGAVVLNAFDMEGDEYKALRDSALGSLLLTSMADDEMIAHGLALDPQNEQGLHERALMAQLRTVSDDSAAKAFSDQIVAFAKLETVHDKELVIQMLVSTANWNMSEELLNQPAVGRALAERALALGPDDEELRSSLEALLVENADESGEG